MPNNPETPMLEIGPDQSQRWGTYMLSIYVSRKPPALGTVDAGELEEKAREVLKDQHGEHIIQQLERRDSFVAARRSDAFMYAFGSAGTGSTYRANMRALQRYKIVPRMLIDASVRNLEVNSSLCLAQPCCSPRIQTTIFGVKHTSPLIIAPIGVQGIFHADGESATARAAKKLGVPFIMSTASTRSIEELARENGNGHRWYQLYWSVVRLEGMLRHLPNNRPKTNEVTLSLLNRAKANGFKALVVTLDTMTIGWRPHDLATAYMPFAHGVGIQVGTSDPVFMARHGLEPVQGEHPAFPYKPADIDKAYLSGDESAKRAVFLGTEWLRECNSGTFKSWEDLKFVRANWDGPLVLKGIQSVHASNLEHKFSPYCSL